MSTDWPLYFRDNLTLGDSNHPAAICCLWMKAARLRDALPASAYGVLGNLYSPDGINYLLRNILAHPTTRAILLCGPDLTHSGASLARLMRDGIDDQHRVGETGAQIDREIPVQAIDEFRQNVRLVDLTGVNDPEKIRGALAELNDALPGGAFAEPRVFPRSVPAADELPAETTGFVWRGEKIISVWVNLLAAILAFGRRDLTAYTVHQRELLDVVAVLHDADDDAELPAWAPLTREQLDAYTPQLLTPQRPENIAYTYGERLFDFNGRDQIAGMVEELTRTRYSRRAVAALWDPARDPGANDPPCLNLLQARARDGMLHLTAYFRSHDVFRAWLMNAYGLRRVQKEIAARVGNVMLGDLVIVSHSAHIYADSWDAARQIVQTHEREYVKNPRLIRDPRGSFNIRLEGFQIHVDHYSPAGNLLATFSGANARTLQRELAFFVSRVDHAIYVGMELAKAELALKNNWRYTQDVDLRVENFDGAATSSGQMGL
ncbi:MAG: hypothetical protein HY327_00690 [Chloroflexi bacterium]|nr:hypothetical protein [Chloroflexota bacterium]